MWDKSKLSISAGDYSKNTIAGRDINLFINKNIPTNLVDKNIEEEVAKLKKSRFFLEFDSTWTCYIFVDSVRSHIFNQKEI